jgi:oligoendopeptidase F
MNNKIERPYESMSAEELRAELKRLKDNLCDLEETHAFTFGKTTVHIGAERAQAMQEEYEEECREFSGQIARLEGILNKKGG